MSLTDTIAAGKAALAAARTRTPATAAPAPTPAPRQRAPRRDRSFFEPPAPLLDPATDWRAEISERASATLKGWIDARADYEAEREAVLAEMARTSVIQPSTYPDDQRDLTLTGQPLAAEDRADPKRRRALIQDTLARWVWLQRRAFPKADYGGPYKFMTMDDAVQIAAEVLTAEIAGRR